MLKKLLLFTSLLLAAPTFAQNVQQSGTVTRNHVPVWISSGVVGDGGSSADSPISSLGITNNGANGFCINSARQSSAGYNAFCFGASTTSAATISLQNFGSATAQGIQFVINGTAQGLPTVSPLPATVNDFAVFATTTGSLKDSGLSTTNGITNAVLAQMAANTTKCNPTGSTANAQDCALSSILPTATRSGDVIYWNGTTWVTLAGNNSGTQVLQETSAGVPSWTAAGTGTVTSITCGNGLSGGTITTTGTCTQRSVSKQVFLAGTSGTYTTPAGVAYIDITLVGGGAGGGGGNNATPGTTGGNTCWNTSGAACTSPVYQAGGGTGGNGGAGSSGGAGGAISGSGTCDWQVVGATGQGGSTALSGSLGAIGGAGGSSTLGAAGAATYNAAGGTAGANSGSGGAGGGQGSTTTTTAGGGGGSGATCHVIINAPAATYTYAVANTAAPAAAGTNGFIGGTGAGGQIIVYEH